MSTGRALPPGVREGSGSRVPLLGRAAAEQASFSCRAAWMTVHDSSMVPKKAYSDVELHDIVFSEYHRHESKGFVYHTHPLFAEYAEEIAEWADAPALSPQEIKELVATEGAVEVVQRACRRFQARGVLLAAAERGQPQSLPCAPARGSPFRSTDPSRPTAHPSPVMSGKGKGSGKGSGSGRGNWNRRDSWWAGNQWPADDQSWWQGWGGWSSARTDPSEGHDGSYTGGSVVSGVSPMATAPAQVPKKGGKGTPAAVSGVSPTAAGAGAGSSQALQTSAHHS